MSPASPFPAQMDRFQKKALVVGAVVLAVCVVRGFYNPQQFFRSYLMAFLFWSGISLGSFAVVMLHHLTGGGWGFLIRRLLESGTRTIPLLALLAVPMLFGIPYLYLWAHASAVARDPILQHKQIYLNVPFFVVRTVVYFAAWILLAHFLNRWSGEQDRQDSPALVRRLYNLSGPGLLIYGLTVTLASVDWVMSLEPSWFSTIYSAVFMVGQVLSSLAFMITALMLLVDRTSLSEIVSEKYLNDLGNMLLTFVILWAYVAFSQFLIVWSGNLSDEISWYFNRTRNGWGWIAALLIVFHFFLPFLLLLSRTVKRRVAMLGALAAALLVIRLLDVFWTVEPAFDRTAVRFHWLDWAAVIGIGGIWLAAFVRQLKNRPLLPLHDPRLREMLEEAGASE
jgi:hypothetical protein